METFINNLKINFMASYKHMTVFKKAFELAMDILEVSKKFPKEETYSLTDQIRRSSRSVCANFAEAYRKRRYIAHFVSKLTDCDSENSETDVWIDFSLACKYITPDEFKRLSEKNAEVGKMLGHMIQNPEKYL
jgi:four helix bundle protein